MKTLKNRIGRIRISKDLLGNKDENTPKILCLLFSRFYPVKYEIYEKFIEYTGRCSDFKKISSNSSAPFYDGVIDIIKNEVTFWKSLL